MSMEVFFQYTRSVRNPTVILVNGIEQKATEQKTTQQKQSKTSIHEPTKVCTSESGVLGIVSKAFFDLTDDFCYSYKSLISETREQM